MAERTDRRVPQIRYRGFEDEWAEKELGGIVYKAVDNRGKTPPIIPSGLHPLLEVNSLGDGYPNYSKVTKYVSGSTFRTWFRDHIKKDDVLFSTVGNTGLVSLMDCAQEAAIAQNIVAFRGLNKNDSGFLMAMFQLKKNRDKVREIEMGAVQPSVKVSQLLTVKYNFASRVTEQTKIGGYFKELDGMIALHQRKHGKLVTLKQAMLQKMFPQNGATTPEIRFKGFSEPWDKTTLGAEAVVTMGQSPLGSNYTNNPKDFILVQGNADMKNGYVTPRVWTTQVTKTASEGNLILSVRAPVGDVGKTRHFVVLGRGVAGIKGNEFIFQSLLRMKLISFWDRFSSGSTFDSVNSDDIKSASMLVPCQREQQKIGSYFRQLDTLISKHATQLEKLKQIKSSCLEKMFV